MVKGIYPIDLQALNLLNYLITRGFDLYQSDLTGCSTRG